MDKYDQTSDADLQDIVDNPSETLTHELKDWLDLTDKVVRANIARHIASLANYGGGYIIFGFDDHEREMDPGQNDPKSYNRDIINGIVDKYLVPPIHCEVSLVTTSRTDIIHPVVWVPAHQSVPICTRADGPHDDKGRPQGIRQGTYYIRTSGPKSEPITAPENWRELIRRCILNEREGLLRDISSLISGRERSLNGAHDLLLDWHESSHHRFKLILEETRDFKWPVDYLSNHYQLSYRIVRGESQPVQSSELVRILEQTNQEIREYVWTGWSMFYPFSRDEIRPYFVPAMMEDTEIDVLETNLIDREVQSTTLPDFWRFSGLGYASLVRAYREDRHILRDPDTDLGPGEWLSPYTLIREITEFLHHAVIVSRQFELASAIEIRGSWSGLANRRIDEFEPGVDWRHRVSRADYRDIHGEWSIAEAGSNWEKIVATLATPVSRLFDGLEISADWVRHESRKFRKL